MKWLLILVALVLGLFVVGRLTTGEVPVILVTGWAPFLARVLPRVTINGPTVAVGAAAFVLFTAGVHWLGRTANRTWRPRWSLTAVAAVVVLFAAGICLIGVVHQTGWLLSANEPVLVEVERFKGSDRGTSTNMLKQTVLGFHNFNDSYGGHLWVPASEDGVPLHNWVTPMLPYIGYSTSGLNLKEPWNSPDNRKFFRAPLYVLMNPELSSAPGRNADGYGLAHYAANSRAMRDGAFLSLKELSTGTSNTLLIGEVNAGFEPWGKPGNCRDPVRGVNRSQYGFGGVPGRGGANFAMADGSVRFISDRVSPEVLKALATPGMAEPTDK